MHNTRSLEDVAILCSRTDIFKYSFFPSALPEWNKLDLKIQQSKTLLTFRNALIKIGRPITKPIYNVHNPVGLKFETWSQSAQSTQVQSQFPGLLKSIVFM